MDASRTRRGGDVMHRTPLVQYASQRSAGLSKERFSLTRISILCSGAKFQIMNELWCRLVAALPCFGSQATQTRPDKFASPEKSLHSSRLNTCFDSDETRIPSLRCIFLHEWVLQVSPVSYVNAREVSTRKITFCKLRDVRRSAFNRQTFGDVRRNRQFSDRFPHLNSLDSQRSVLGQKTLQGAKAF